MGGLSIRRRRIWQPEFREVVEPLLTSFEHDGSSQQLPADVSRLRNFCFLDLLRTSLWLHTLGWAEIGAVRADMSYPGLTERSPDRAPDVTYWLMQLLALRSYSHQRYDLFYILLLTTAAWYQIQENWNCPLASPQEDAGDVELVGTPDYLTRCVAVLRAITEII